MGTTSMTYSYAISYFFFSLQAVVSVFLCFSLQGTKCDVREGQDVKDLVAFAQENLKYIDIWVFNLVFS